MSLARSVPRPIRRAVLLAFRRFGYLPVPLQSIKDRAPAAVPGDAQFPDWLHAADARVWEEIRSFTMTSLERVAGLLDATRYITEAQVPGAIVECGVWKGGSMMGVARTLLDLGVRDRELYLFDTFSGMTAPTPEDTLVATGGAAAEILESAGGDKSSRIWARAPLDEVKQNLLRTGYDESRLHFVVGPVEETVPAAAPEQIALLRLDTDWYRSTKHELLHLFPRLARGGVLILDDYGHWQGARQATDEYFSEHGVRLLLMRLDYTGRIAIKVDV